MVVALVYHQHDLIREEIKEYIIHTYKEIKQYTRINVHEQNSHYNLGMVRMSGTFLVKNALAFLKIRR